MNATTQELLNRIATSAKDANDLVKCFKENPAPHLEAVSLLLGQAAFDQAVNRSDDDVKPAEKAERLAKLLNSAQSFKVKESEYTLKREKLDLELQKYKDKVSEKIQSALQEGTREGSISRETIERIEAELKLL